MACEASAHVTQGPGQGVACGKEDAGTVGVQLSEDAPVVNGTPLVAPSVLIVAIAQSQEVLPGLTLEKHFRSVFPPQNVKPFEYGWV